MEVTISKFAKIHGVNYSVAAGFLKFLEQKSVAKIIGTEKNTKGRGKGSNVYEVPNGFSVDSGVISLLKLEE